MIGSGTTASTNSRNIASGTGPEPVVVSPVNPLSPPRLYIWFAAVILAGVLTGFLLSRFRANPVDTGTAVTGSDIIRTATEIGSTDTTTFSDSATGILEVGGSNGEGTHKLVRDGGPSQTVYLVSSVIDLDQYTNQKVEIWGQTLQAKRVGWLMDVGRLKILE